jgi:soluble lytic murein transglycosylase
MRQESIFDDQIVSPAGAVGLMQIMPYTGEEIAGDLKVSFVVDSLYRAETNIRFGTYYLSKLLNQFNGSHVLTLAGYNGGPHNARKWYSRNKDRTFDMFIEDIGYSETRLYVKKVLANYWTYRRLAGLLGYPGA